MDSFTLDHQVRPAADLIVFDKNNQILLIVEVKAHAGFQDQGITQVRKYQRQFQFPFAMFVDPKEIWVFGSGEASESVGPFSTPATLLPYDRNFEQNRISHDYLQGLVEGWLADYTFSWRYSDPPQQSAFATLGLVERLKSGQVAVGGAMN